MTDTPSELRATSDGILRDLDAILALEAEKRTLPPSDPHLIELAERIDDIARRVLAQTGAQRELAREAAAASVPDIPIEAVRRSPAAVLTEWRDIVRRLAAAEPGSAAYAELEILAERLRDEYQTAFDDTRDPDVLV